MSKGKRRADRFRPRQMIGKYRIEMRLATGGFADVYRAADTIEGVKVALKIPKPHFVERHGLDDFRKEVRVTARLDHPNIMRIKNADFVDGIFIIVYPLGEGTLAERLRTRISAQSALDYASQILEAVAHAHEQNVIHCDIKPENFVLFDHNSVLRMTDFGIARFTFRTMIQGSGSGTLGYLAPEQAMGKLSFRSDVFSTGLVLYRMFAGRLPEWPFEWPPPGHENLKRKLNPKMVELIRRAMSVNIKRRYANGVQMNNVFTRIKTQALNGETKKRRRTKRRVPIDLDAIRWSAFKRQFGRVLDARYDCGYCGGPVSEAMQACPWCGTKRTKHYGDTRFPATCPRCRRGVKLDWTYCAWCYGPGIGPISDREYSDRAYTARCTNKACSRKELMPHMRYCPWCRRKTTQKWKIPNTRATCPRCGSGVAGDYWHYCAWCGLGLE